MPVCAERQSGAGPEIRLQAALVRTVDGLLPKSFGLRRADSDLAREPEVRIHLPPADSLSLSRSSFRRSRTRLSARVWAAGLATGSAETRRGFRYRVNRRPYLC